MMQDLKQYQVFQESELQKSINEQPNQIQQMQKQQITKFDNNKNNDLNQRVQRLQQLKQLKSLHFRQNSMNSPFNDRYDNQYDKLQNNKQKIQYDNHIEKLQKNQKYRRCIQYNSLGNRYTNSDGGSKYDQKRQSNFQDDNLIDSFNQFEDSKYVQQRDNINKIQQNYQNQKINEMYKKKQDMLSCQFYSKNTKKDIIKSNQTNCYKQIKEEQDHNDSSESNKSRISKNISEQQDQKDQQSKHEEMQSLRISKLSEFSDQMKNYFQLEGVYGIEYSCGSDFHNFDSNKSSLNHTPLMKSQKSIKINKNQIPNLKIQQQSNAKYFSQASSPRQNNQQTNYIRKNPISIMIDNSVCQSNLISPIGICNDIGQHKNTMSFGKQQEGNSFQKNQQKIHFQNIVPFDQKSPINEESKSFEFNIKSQRKQSLSKSKQSGQEQKIKLIKSQSEKKQQKYEDDKKIKELEQELKLKVEQIKFKDDIINEQNKKIQSYNQRINQIPNEDDWNSDFHNIIEFIDDYKRNIYQQISNNNTNITLINLMKQKFQEQYKHQFNNNQQISEQKINPQIITNQKNQILQLIFENIILLQSNSIEFGFELGQTILQIFQKIFSLSKREKFRIRLLDMNECLQYEIQELMKFLKNQKNIQNKKELKEILESEINILKYIYQTIFNISNLFKERIMQIQEGHKQMLEQLSKNTLCN